MQLNGIDRKTINSRENKRPAYFTLLFTAVFAPEHHRYSGEIEDNLVCTFSAVAFLHVPHSGRLLVVDVLSWK